MRRQRNGSPEADRFLRQALAGLLGLKLRSGARVRELRLLVEECIKRAGDESGLKTGQQGLDIHRLGSVLRAWHRETRYLTSDGRPLPLMLNGKVGLRALITTYYPSTKVPAVLATLKRAGLIRKHAQSHWVPTSGHARISADSQETLEHVSEGVSRFVETVLNNVNSRSKESLLFEQSCKVRRLPKSNVPAFRIFVRQQAIAFLTAVDDWLEARVERTRHRVARSKTCSAGVFTFAYVDSATKNRMHKKKKR